MEDHGGGEENLLKRIFSIANDTVSCPVCGQVIEVAHRFCAYCGSLNSIYPQVLPLLSRDERETANLKCSDQWHRECLELDPHWMFCYDCGLRVRPAN